MDAITMHLCAIIVDRAFADSLKQMESVPEVEFVEKTTLTSNNALAKWPQRERDMQETRKLKKRLGGKPLWKFDPATLSQRRPKSSHSTGVKGLFLAS